MTAGLQVGVFVTPDATDPESTLAQLVAADEAGLDVVGVQDHPYQRRFFDTWTLLSYVAAQTQRVRLVPDVASLPLRPPAMLAKAASADAHDRHRVIDEAARRAGRDPGGVRRLLNAEVKGPASGWAGQLARLATEYRFDTVLVTVPAEDPVGFIRRLGEDAAPAARAEVG
jgi:Luciferase-like monooxygenase